MGALVLNGATVFFLMFPFDPPENLRKTFSYVFKGKVVWKVNTEKKRVDQYAQIHNTIFLGIVYKFRF